MRLTIITHKIAKGDGQGRVNYEIAREALNQGNEVTLIAREISKELKQDPGVKSVILDVGKWPTELVRNFIFALKATQWLSKNEELNSLVVTNGFTTFSKSDVNLAHFVHGAWIKSEFHSIKERKTLYAIYQWLFTKLNSFLEKHSFNKSKKIVAVSEKVKRELKLIGIKEEKISIVLNGVDMNEFFPGKVARKTLNLPEGVPLALFVGDIRTSRKNLDTVLKSLVKVPELNLVVVGDTRKIPYMKLANELMLTERVHFLGYKNNIPEIMRAVDFFVLPSRYDPFGMVILEAMASGLPVITSRKTGVSDFITSKEGIVLENPNGTDSLTQTMSVLSKNPEKRMQMGKAGRELAKKYTCKIMAEKYIKLFRELNKNE